MQNNTEEELYNLYKQQVSNQNNQPVNPQIQPVDNTEEELYNLYKQQMSNQNTSQVTQAPVAVPAPAPAPSTTLNQAENLNSQQNISQTQNNLNQQAQSLPLAPKQDKLLNFHNRVMLMKSKVSEAEFNNFISNLNDNQIKYLIKVDAELQKKHGVKSLSGLENLLVGASQGIRTSNYGKDQTVRNLTGLGSDQVNKEIEQKRRVDLIKQQVLDEVDPSTVRDVSRLLGEVLPDLAAGGGAGLKKIGTKAAEQTAKAATGLIGGIKNAIFSAPAKALTKASGASAASSALTQEVDLSKDQSIGNFGKQKLENALIAGATGGAVSGATGLASKAVTGAKNAIDHGVKDSINNVLAGKDNKIQRMVDIGIEEEAKKTKKPLDVAKLFKETNLEKVKQNPIRTKEVEDLEKIAKGLGEDDVNGAIKLAIKSSNLQKKNESDILYKKASDLEKQLPKKEIDLNTTKQIIDDYFNPNKKLETGKTDDLTKQLKNIKKDLTNKNINNNVSNLYELYKNLGDLANSTNGLSKNTFNNLRQSLMKDIDNHIDNIPDDGISKEYKKLINEARKYNKENVQVFKNDKNIEKILNNFDDANTKDGNINTLLNNRNSLKFALSKVTPEGSNLISDKVHNDLIKKSTNSDGDFSPKVFINKYNELKKNVGKENIDKLFNNKNYLELTSILKEAEQIKPKEETSVIGKLAQKTPFVRFDGIREVFLNKNNEKFRELAKDNQLSKEINKLRNFKVESPKYLEQLKFINGYLASKYSSNDNEE